MEAILKFSDAEWAAYNIKHFGAQADVVAMLQERSLALGPFERVRHRNFSCDQPIMGVHQDDPHEGPMFAAPEYDDGREFAL